MTLSLCRTHYVIICEHVFAGLEVFLGGRGGQCHCYLRRMFYKDSERSTCTRACLTAPDFSTNGAFPLHGTAWYGSVRFTFGGFSTGYCACTWYFFSTTLVPPNMKGRHRGEAILRNGNGIPASYCAFVTVSRYFVTLCNVYYERTAAWPLHRDSLYS